MNERVKWVDVAKGIGIVLVIYGHVGKDIFTTWIYTFHVPLFFFLSGYFFNPDKKPREFFLSKAKGLLLPYITLGIPLFLINLRFGFDPLELLKSYIIQQRASTLWFIAALFMQFVIAYVLYNTISQTLLRWGVVLSLSIVGIVLWRIGINSLPWNIDVSIITLPFFCFGHYLRTNTKFVEITHSIPSIKSIAFFMLINIVGTTIMCNIPYPTIDLCSSHFSFEPLAYFTALTGILAVCLISCKYYSKFAAYIGRNSLVFFVWQQDIAIMTISILMKNLHISNTSNNTFIILENILIVLASLIILALLNEIISRNKVLRMLIGK